MEFSKIIGKIDPKLVHQAEVRLSQIFLELGTRYSNEHVGTGMGGDPLIFTLMYPVEHVCTMNIPTAATDGKRYYWNPKFVLKQSKIGLRIICGHEAWHAIYMHPQRRGSRLPKLWNIAVDYIVNGMVMDDLKARKMDPATEFTKHLGRYMTLDQYCQLLKDPFSPIPGFEGLNTKDTKSSNVTLPAADEDRELTDQEIKELERREKSVSFFYADPYLEEDMKRPEKIYDLLYSLLPKCPKCGSVGKYQPPKPQDKNNSKGKGKNKDKSNNKDKSEDKDKSDQSGEEQSGSGNDQQDDHNHGDGDSCDSCNSPGSEKGCDCCGDGIDIFDVGGTVDDHMDTEESEEKLAKRISDAMETAKKMAGYVPAALEDELGKLTAPKISWQDIIRTRLLKARAGNGRNDWTKFRSRPMFTGLLVPKRKNYFANFGCLLDTSGSMSQEDIAFGVSQLQSLDERAEGVIVCADAEIYWSQATKIKKANAEELSKVKIVGRGGTMFASYFRDYEKEIGKCDFLVVITDGYLLDTDIVEMQNPGIDVYWLVTSTCDFKPPFGKALYLRD